MGRKKAIRYNKQHPRPKFGIDDVEHLPRTIDEDVPELIEITDSIPVKIEGERVYGMGELTVRHRMVPDDVEFSGHSLTISHPFRYPKWDEVTEARYRLIPDDVFMAMPLPPSDQYLNLHPYAFNLIEIRDVEVTERVYGPDGTPLGVQKVRKRIT